MAKIGWFSNSFTLGYIQDSSIIKNQREVPIIRYLLEQGHQFYWFGPKTKINKNDKKTYKIKVSSTQLAKLPKYDSEKWKISHKHISHCLKNYKKKYKVKFPKLDIIVLNAFPSFQQKNLHFYLLWKHYCNEKNTKVYAYDVELNLFKHLVSGKKIDLKKRWMSFSGSDKCFSVKEFNGLVKKTTFLYPIPRKGIKLLNKKNPNIKFKTYYFPYDKTLYGNTKIWKFFKHRHYNLIYIGNDSGRRSIMKKYFGEYAKWYGKVDIWGGGTKEKVKTYNKRFIKQHPFINWHGQVAHEKVQKLYRQSMFTLSIPKPRFEKVGFQVGRWLEAVFNGCILFIPRELKFAKEFVEDPFFVVKDCDDLVGKIKILKTFSDKKLVEVNRKQKEKFRNLFSIEKQANVILEGVKGKSTKTKKKVSLELAQAFRILIKLAQKEGIDLGQ